ncbi:hypothetical protein [Streptomyces sp. NBC_00258]|uniref:hypothetical protein n=1 Tax=Streptomyces sp. NBC_00258 TaxID=2903642 RepID=UPI002E2C66A0|nr:hypothetical protein [Streptomyces sp. NBC_00258]
MDYRNDRVWWERDIEPVLLRPYERHSASPVPYPDETHRGRPRYGGGKASRMVRQQVVHPSVSRLWRQRHTAHERIGMFHELCPFRAIRVRPQEHVAEQHAWGV